MNIYEYIIPVNRSCKASPRECAGSEDTTNVLNPLSANLTAQLAAEVVLPTPPYISCYGLYHYIII